MPKLLSLNHLKSLWFEGRYRSSDTRFYILLNIVILAVLKAFPESPSNLGGLGWGVKSFGVLIALGIWLYIFHRFWDANGGDVGTQFLDKMLSLGSVITYTRLLPISCLILLALLAAEKVAASSGLELGIFARLGFVAVIIGVNIYYSLVVGKKVIAEIRKAELKKMGWVE